MALNALAALAVPFLAAFPALHAGPSSTGVGIGVAPVCLTMVALPGHSYSLGSVHVVNTGSGGESITLHAIPPVNGLPGQHFPPSWVSAGYPELLWVIGRNSVSVGAGQGADIPLTLNVPAGSQPGAYAADLMATTSPGGGAGLALGAGAATNLMFTVGPGGSPPPSCNPLTPGPKVTPERKQPVIANLAAPAANGASIQTLTSLLPFAVIALIVWALAKWAAPAWAVLLAVLLGVILSGTIVGPYIHQVLSLLSGGRLQ